MFNFLVTAEGGLTTAGYVVAVIAVLDFDNSDSSHYFRKTHLH